jgi:ribosomal protein S18 acetylase RimI-like enzyme
VTIVRQGTVGDLERIVEIKVRNWKDTYAQLIPAEVLRPLLDSAAQLDHVRRSVESADAILLVAEDHTGNVIGFALALLDQGPEPWLESLHVHPDFQSRGAGTLLMRATANELRSRGYKSMRLGVVDGNTAAERFYERLGGVDAGREPVSWAIGVIHHTYRWPNLDALA